MFANGSVAMFLFQVSLIYSEATSNIEVHIRVYQTSIFITVQNILSFNLTTKLITLHNF